MATSSYEEQFKNIWERIKGKLKMKIFAWLKSRLIATVIGAVVGGVIGGTITGVIAYRIFQKQLLANQYSIFAEDMQEAVKSHSMWKAV